MESDRANDRVEDDEILYRRVLAKDIPLVEGERRLSTQAFTDRDREPSVDRAKLRNHHPELTQGAPSFAVVSLSAREVRRIELPLRTADGREMMVCPFDVRPKPEEDNPSHAEIYTILPEFNNRSGFEKLLKALRKIARIVILPAEEP